MSFTCLEDCVFATIKQKDYLRIFSVHYYNKVELDETFRFFDSVSMFEGQNMMFLQKLINTFQERSYSFGDIIIKQGDDINDLFIIKSGVFSVEYTYENSVVNGYGAKYFVHVNNERFTQSRLFELVEKIPANEHLKVSI